MMADLALHLPHKYQKNNNVMEHKFDNMNEMNQLSERQKLLERFIHESVSITFKIR